MADSLKVRLARIAEDYDAEPNVNTRLQRQIDLLAEHLGKHKHEKAKAKTAPRAKAAKPKAEAPKKRGH